MINHNYPFNTKKWASDRGRRTFSKKSPESKTTCSQRANSVKTLIQKSKYFKGAYQDELSLCIKPELYIDISNEMPTNKYKMISKLGEGSFGTVYYAKNVNNQSEVAIKKISKSSHNRMDNSAITNEANIVKNLSHPNIIKVYECFNTPSNFYVVNDYCKYGELYKYIKQYFNETQIAVLFHQLLSGLSYLNENNIMHRDLKLENIMIYDIDKYDATETKYFWIKLIDFGFAKSSISEKKEKSVIGTCYYMAPEIFKHDYTIKCDSWSAGVILYMLATGRAPFEGKNSEEIIEKIKIGVFNRESRKYLVRSLELRDWIDKLLEIDVNKRLSPKEALNHQFFKRFNPMIIYESITNDKKEKLVRNLLHYKLNTKFQQIVLTYLCHNIMASEETKDITKLFKWFNTANNGKLTKEELLNGIKYYVREEEADSIIDELFISLDGDNNGYIEFGEFLLGCLDKEAINNQCLQYAFNYFDKYNTNSIIIKDIQLVLQELKCKNVDEICSNIFNKADINKDGVIDYNEFKLMVIGE